MAKQKSTPQRQPANQQQSQQQPERTSQKPRRGDRLNVRVERLAVGGRGVARHEGLVIFVSDAAPDEEVEVQITFVKKNFAEADLVRVISPSPARIRPPCPVAGICGGCNWQHIDAPTQLNWKRQLVIESLQKFSGFQIEESQVEPIVASPKAFRYRNRIQLHHSGPRMGFFQRGSHDIVDIDDCPITDERLAHQIPALKKEFEHSKAGRFEIFVKPSGGTARMDRTAVGAAEAPFSQVNTEQNENLIATVLKLVERHLGSSHTVYDLYAGGGNFTFPLSAAFPNAHLVGVELNSESVRTANRRARDEQIENRIEFLEASVDEFVASQLNGEGAFVLLDPPRTGCGPGVMDNLARLKPNTILYISCHPVTLARDLKPLHDAGYQLQLVKAFDMFPQTDHVESVAVLRRKSEPEKL